MKKLIGILLAISLAVQVSAYTRNDAFTDLTGDEYYAEAAFQLRVAGVISGYEGGSFCPDRIVTRAEMAALICRLVGAEKTAQQYKGRTTDLTQDVSADHWASGYVAFAVENKIVNGDGNGKFRPEDKVSYKEATKMLVCAAGLEDLVETDPNDWAAGYIDVALEYCILGNVLYTGGEYASRSDVAIMLYNIMTRIPLEDKYSQETEDDTQHEEEKDDEESAFEEWDKYDHYDENGNFIEYTLEVTMTGCGGIYNTGGKYPPGTTVPVYIYPGTESGFIRWTTSAGWLEHADQPTAVLHMPDEDVVVCAEFAPEGVVVREYNEEEDYWYYIDEQPQDDFTEMENEVIRLVNEERKKHGLKELLRDEDLCNVASAHSRDMYERSFFSHDNPDGMSPFDRMHDYGIFYMAAAENIAKGQASPEAVMDSWMNSSGHRANILSEKMKYIGVGICKSDYGYIWTQCFIG